MFPVGRIDSEALIPRERARAAVSLPTGRPAGVRLIERVTVSEPAAGYVPGVVAGPRSGSSRLLTTVSVGACAQRPKTCPADAAMPAETNGLATSVCA